MSGPKVNMTDKIVDADFPTNQSLKLASYSSSTWNVEATQVERIARSHTQQELLILNKST